MILYDGNTEKDREALKKALPEGSEIVRILNSDEASAIGDLDTLIDVITTEHFKPKPQEAANLSEDELLMQMSRLKKLKK